jgi:hypothetical protein
MRRRAVWGEAVMVGGLGCRCFLVGGCEVAASVWLVQCSAVRGTSYVFECVRGMGLRTCVAWAKKCRFAGMSVWESVVRCGLCALYVHRVWWVW